MNTKKPQILLPVAAAFLALVGLSSNADARVHVSFGSGSHYSSGQNGHSYNGSRSTPSTHGQRYIKKRVFAGYDSHRRPIYRYVRVPVSSSRCGTNTGCYQKSRSNSRGSGQTGSRPSGYSHSYVRVR